MSNNTPLVEIDLTPEYKRNLRKLSKKYRQIRLDTQAILEELQGGNFIGDRLSGMGEEYVIFKVRVKNSDIQKGKSAGYRFINCILQIITYCCQQFTPSLSEKIQVITKLAVYWLSSTAMNK